MSKPPSPDPVQVNKEQVGRTSPAAAGHVVEAHVVLLGRFVDATYAEGVAARLRAILEKDRTATAPLPIPAANDLEQRYEALRGRLEAYSGETLEEALERQLKAPSAFLHRVNTDALERLSAKLGRLQNETIEEALDRVLATLGDAVEKSEAQNRAYFDDAMKATEIAGVSPTKSFRETVLMMKSLVDDQKRHIAALRAELFEVERRADPSYIAKKFFLGRAAREGIAKLRARLPFPL